jgi:hypothetical protein
MSAETDLLRELQTELAGVTPAPEFAARVRARVAEARRPRGWLRLGIGLAGAAATLVAVVVSMRPAGELPDPVVIRTTAPPAPAPAPALRSEPADGPVTPAAPVAPRPTRPGPAPVRARTADPRFEVITTQAAVLEELWRVATARAGTPPRPAAELPPPSIVVDSDGLIVVPDLVVDPIVVLPIGAPPGGQGRIQRVTSPQATGSPR